MKIISGCFWVILMFRVLVKFISECFGLIDVWSLSKNYFLMFWVILIFRVLVKIIYGCFWVVVLVKTIYGCFWVLWMFSCFSKNDF